MNGGSAVASDYNGYKNLLVRYTFPAVPEPIESVSAIITPPVAGASPDYNPVLPSGAHYYSKSISFDTFRNDVVWYDATASGVQLYPDSDVFEVGHVYGVGIYLTAEDGYAFTSATTATINGLTPKYVEDSYIGGQYILRLTYEFPEASAKPVVITQPASLNVAEGQTATFTVAASGAETYQWSYKAPGTSSWKNAPNNGTAPTYSFTAGVSPYDKKGTYQIRCKVSNSSGSVYTSTVTMNITFRPTITTQPVSVTVAEGQTATFTVAANGAESYQWYYQKPGESTWNIVKTKGKSATYSVTTEARHNGYQYACVVTNADGSVTSDAATLTVE